MKFVSWERMTELGGRHFHLTISGMDFMTAPLDRIDLELLRECERSNSIADKLLALECIARRIEQAEANAARDTTVVLP